jgi:type III secretion protein V
MKQRSSFLRGGAGEKLSRHSDILLAGLVVGIVAMMIIPLPTLLLDILITTNISLAVILLLVCIYISDALRFAALPSVLLITTLFRLGLNVSSTRLILLQADAGEVIRSFGEFVVAGNLVVGGVIFLILTLIQFVVIAKGSERVAEVAARFTLDAMPGKQMAIDADLRAGAIDLDQARRMRAALGRESQLYGSMDGAMKFVKGDAIAGILITVINIVGGLLIGVLQRGMSVGDAAMLYSILTIGDGLVSQIPALLISTGAGIVVTRVASEDEGGHLGRDIGAQVLAQPKAIAIAAGLLALLAIVPGMPTLPFLVLAIAIGSLAWSLLQLARRREARRRPSGRPVEAPLDEPAAADEELTPPAQIALEISPALTPLIDTATDGGRFMRELIPGLRELIWSDLGVVLPGVRVRGEAPGLSPRGYRILLSEIPMGAGELPEDRVLVLADAERLADAGLPEGAAASAPGLVALARELPSGLEVAARAAGLEVVDPATRMVLHLGRLLRDYAHELVGIQETQQLLDSLERTHPALVHEVVPKLISIHTLAEVLRRLVEEGISIRGLREILQALAEWAPVEKDPVMLVEYVRMALRRYICHKYSQDAGPARVLRAYLLDPAIEQTIRESIHRSDRGSYLALEPELSRDIVQALRRQLELQPGDEPSPAVLTTMELRRYVRRLFEVDFPELPVLSFTELLPELQVQPVARVSVS